MPDPTKLAALARTVEEVAQEEEQVRALAVGRFLLALPGRFHLCGGMLGGTTVSRLLLPLVSDMPVPEIGLLDLRTSPPSFMPRRMARHGDVADAIAAAQIAGLTILEGD